MRSRTASYVLICVLSAELLNAQTCVSPPSGIVAWWPFDETSGTNVGDIAGRHDGVLVNNPTSTVGLVGSSRRFNGSNQYVGVPDSNDWAFGSSEFTIELWAKFDAPPGGDVGHPGDVLISHDEGSGTQNKWFFAVGGGFLNFHVNSPATGPIFLPLVPFQPDVTRWYHLAVTRKRTTYNIFVDGVLKGTAIINGLIPNANAPLTIGFANEPFAGFFNGYLDEVTIYNTALTETQIHGIVQAANAGKCKTLAVSTRIAPALQLGTTAAFAFSATFGATPLTWSVANGTVPPGTTLQPTGMLTGTPTRAGQFTFSVMVRDNSGASAQKAFTQDVLMVPPPADLRINKTGTVAVPGRTLDYFISVENTGTTTATSFAVTEVVQPYFSVSSVNPPADLSQLNSTPIISWVLPRLEPGEIALFSYKAVLDPVTAMGSNIIGGPAGVNVDWQRIGACLGAAGVGTLVCTACTIICGAIGPACLGPQGALPSCPGAVAGCLLCILQCGQSAGEIARACHRDSADDSTSHEQPANRPIDPNEKRVLTSTKYIQPHQRLIYPIHYENVGTVEALDVFITDTLDTNLDLSTLELFTPGATVDLATRTIKWNLRGRNLPPKGTDNVLAAIRPKPNLPSGTIIRNKATIQFEIFETITTNEVESVIDNIRPSCSVNPLPIQTNTLDIPLSWTGIDQIGEIDSYSIFAAENGGTFSPFLSKTKSQSASFNGQLGKSYAFRCVAIDTAGNVELQADIAEARTTITGTPSCGASSISQQTISVPPAGEKIALNLSAPACKWAASSNASWAQVYPLSGTGNASVDVTVFPNFSTRSRTAHIMVAGRTVTVNQAAATATADQRFVELIYFSFLGRLPTTAERDLQVREGLKPPRTRTDLTMDFYNTEEFNLGGRFIAGLYVALLARDAEFSGWLFQRNALATGGITQLQLVTNFLNSLEFQQKYPNLTNPDFVRLMYRNILGREPSVGEVNAQVAALPQIGRIGMANAFLNSSEFRSRIDARLTAFLLHSTLLARDGSASDLAFRRGQLEAHPPVPVRTLVESFLQSAEFQELLR